MVTEHRNEPPIATLTLNPTLDVSSTASAVIPNHKLRCSSPTSEPGGGGFNVSRVCDRLGRPTVAVAPLGGAFGARLKTLMAAEGIPLVSTDIGGETRQSVTIAESASDQQFRFVFPGPQLTQEELDRCLKATIDAARTSRCLVVSGSMPEGVGPDSITRLVADLPDVTVIVDTSGPALADAVAAGVGLIKPSARELATLVDRELNTELDVQTAAEELMRGSTVGALLVSIGAGGAILAQQGGPTTRLRAPTVKVASAVGAGDSLVAGLACALQAGDDLISAAAFGVACGTAAVLSPGTELCRVEDINRLRPSVKIG